MPKFAVSKSIRIAAPLEKVHSFVRDFRQWPAWSPWLIAEPETHLNYADDGNSYGWDGKITGSGEMAITRDSAPDSIDCRLTFLKPWRSVNSVRFLFAEKEGGTEVTWTMEGSLPFFMFWMKPMMTAFIGMDYQRGLMMLKAVLETGTNPSKLTFTGRQSFPGCHYIGVHTTCSVGEIAPNMQRDMARLKEWLDTSGTQPAGPPFSIYHKWDPVKGITGYTVSIPLETASASPPNGFASGEIPACEAYVIRHTGPYPYLGNAWSAGAMRERSKVFVPNKKIRPFEIYQSDPGEVPENELVTVLHFPVK